MQRIRLEVDELGCDRSAAAPDDHGAIEGAVEELAPPGVVAAIPFSWSRRPFWAT